MKRSSRSSMRCAPLLFWSLCASLVGCAEEVPEDNELEQFSQELGAPTVVTNCTGAAISAAVAAGGDVVLSCGSAPLLIDVPPTTVVAPTRLRAAIPGTITLTHASTLFSVRSNISFEIDDIKFTRGGFMAVHATAGTITLVNTSFDRYPNFVISVHNTGTRLTVTGGRFTDNGGSQAPAFAGSIYSEGATTSVVRSTFSNNRSTGSGGAIAFAGPLSVDSSTFANNSSANGGAIAAISSASLSLTNSTFVGNRATTSGGAVSLSSAASATIRNSTFSNNSSPRGSFAGNVQLTNSILVDSLSPSTVPCVLSGSSNLQWPATMSRCGAGFRVDDPRLGALANNGGPTQTMALLAGSAAIDRAFLPCAASDQRGMSRPRDGDGNGVATCDLGAYER